MIRLFSIMFAFVLMAMISVAHAEVVNLDGLSDAAKAELVLKAAQLRKDAASIPNAQHLADYASVGEQIGKAIASTAKELGVEVNNFANTKVGTLAIFLIMWHFFGSMMIHVMFGSTWLIVTGSLWVYFFKRLYMQKLVTYHENGKKKAVSYAATDDRSGNMIGLFITVLAVIVAVGLVAIFSF